MLREAVRTNVSGHPAVCCYRTEQVNRGLVIQRPPFT